jgi:5-methylcytosine-specific restriction protein A
MPELPKPEKRGPKPRKYIKSNPKNKGKRTSRRRKARKAKLKDADRLFSEYIRTRDNWTCQCCGRTRENGAAIQCAHIVSRRYRATRWSRSNAIALCSKCHVYYTYRVLEFEVFIEERYPGRLAELKPIAIAGIHQVDYTEICTFMLVWIEELKNASGVLQHPRIQAGT